jgi:hypothetical protein
MSSSLPSAEVLQAQMRQVRSEMGTDVQEIVDSARVLTDWQYYVRTYPWLCLGAAAALGYLVIPTRIHYVRPDPATVAELARQHKLVVQPTQDTKPKQGLVAAIAAAAVSALLQGGMGLARQGLNSYLSHQFDGQPRGSKPNGSHSYEESGR